MVVGIDGRPSNILQLKDNIEDDWDEILSDLELQDCGDEEILE